MLQFSKRKEMLLELLGLQSMQEFIKTSLIIMDYDYPFGIFKLFSAQTALMV
jgi:hypothetical protein